ncbi:MAG TPA: rod shape-determining protein MreD, partial [Acidimicrobiales bacterium]|nr:rod shape-determining protein MreD [Acidimicrobiales bacterium]
LTEIRLQGATVELMMVIAILAGFHGGPERGALVAFFAGLLQDSLLSVPLGLHALVFPPLAVAVSSLEQRMVRSKPATDAVALLLATTAGIFTVAGVGLLFGLSPYDPETLLVRILTAAVMTTAIAAPVNRAVRWAVLGGLPPDIKLRTVGS